RRRAVSTSGTVPGPLAKPAADALAWPASVEVVWPRPQMAAFGLGGSAPVCPGWCGLVESPVDAEIRAIGIDCPGWRKPGRQPGRARAETTLGDAHQRHGCATETWQQADVPGALPISARKSARGRKLA